MARSKLHGAIREAEELLRREDVRAADLLTAIHAVNPTSRELHSEEARSAYAVKSRLQSRLILKYPDDVAIELVAGQPGLLSLRYRPQDRDACHAVLSELEPDARNKVQWQLDTADAEPVRAQARPAAPRRFASPKSGAFEQGQEALADYEYERARECFLSAFDDGDGRAALAMLKLFVENLAAYEEALAFGQGLEPSLLTAQILLLLANAAAQLGNEAACRSWMKREAFAEPLCLLVEHSLKRGELEAATRLLTEARALAPSAPEVLSGQLAVDKFRATQREPTERELAALIASGQHEAAVQRAREILKQWPESSVARALIREDESRSVGARLSALLRDAQLAAGAGDDERAIVLWVDAAQLGADVVSLMSSARERVEAKRRQRAREDVVARVSAGPDLRSLDAYLDLDGEDRRLVRAALDEPSLEWLEELGTPTERERPRDLAAVLAFRTATNASLSERDVLLNPHLERVRRLHAGRVMLDELARHAEARALGEARAKVELAQQALTDRDWARAAALSDGAWPLDLKERAGHLSRTAREHLEAASRLCRFTELLQAGRDLEALSLLNAAERDEAADQAQWRQHRKSMSERLDHTLVVAGSDSAADTSAADFAHVRLVFEPSYALEPGAEYAYWVTTHHDHLFVRKISVAEERVVFSVALRLPEPLPEASSFVDGQSLWVTGGRGGAIRLDTGDWHVLAWFRRPEVDPGEQVEEAVTVPGGRFQWLFIHSQSKGARLRVIDLERGRVHRELSMEGLGLRLVTTERGPRVWVSGDERGGQLYRADGSLDATLPLGTSELCRAPGGDSQLALVAPAEGDEGGIRVLHFPERGGGPQLVDELTDSFNDGVRGVATAVDAPATFVLYADVEEEYWLVCYGFEKHMLKRLWRVRCPQPCILFQDLLARSAVLVAARGAGLRCVSLTTRPPELQDLLAEPFVPPRQSLLGLFCGTSHRKEFGSLVRSLEQASERDRHRELERVCNSGEHDVLELTTLARSLRHARLLTEARQVLKHARTQSPFAEAPAIELAEFALAESDWAGVLAALEGLSGAPHNEHLRALALFRLGRLDEAKSAFERCLGQVVSGCEVQGWPEWIDALQGRSDGPAAEFLSRVSRAQTAAKEERPRAALDLLDVPAVWSVFDVQLGVGMAVTALANDQAEGIISVRARLIAAAILDEFSSPTRRELPLGKLAQGKALLDQFPANIKRWLAGLGTKGQFGSPWPR